MHVLCACVNVLMLWFLAGSVTAVIEIVQRRCVLGRCMLCRRWLLVGGMISQVAWYLGCHESHPHCMCTHTRVGPTQHEIVWDGLKTEKFKHLDEHQAVAAYALHQQRRAAWAVSEGVETNSPPAAHAAADVGGARGWEMNGPRGGPFDSQVAAHAGQPSLAPPRGAWWPWGGGHMHSARVAPLFVDPTGRSSAAMVGGQSLRSESTLEEFDSPGQSSDDEQEGRGAMAGGVDGAAHATGSGSDAQEQQAGWRLVWRSAAGAVAEARERPKSGAPAPARRGLKGGGCAGDDAALGHHVCTVLCVPLHLLHAASMLRKRFVVT